MATFLVGGSLTDASASANAQILEFQADFRVAFYEAAMFPAIATEPTAINGKSFEFTFFPTLDIDTTPLVEADEVDSTTLTPTKKIMEAKQYGRVITVTELADWQTRSKASRAAGTVIGINAGQTLTKICIEAADMSTNVIYPNRRANDGAVLAGDTLDADSLEQAYTDLAAAEVPMLADGLYVLQAHERAISDIRNSQGWIEINRYEKSTQVLRNEVGTYKGFKIVRNNLSTVKADAGSGNVDLYYSYALGKDAIAYGEETAPKIVVRRNDKLDRFTHIGWKWIGVHRILRDESVRVIRSSSSRGSNT